MNQDPTPNNIQEEIDLRFVYRRVRRLFSNTWNSFRNLILTVIRLIIKRWGIVFLFCLLGAGLGIGLFMYLRPVYMSTMVLSSSTMNNEYCADEIENLNQIIKDKTPDLLAEHLKINNQVAGALKKIEFDNYDERLNELYDEKDTIVLGLPFKIRVYSYDNTVFKELQTALVKHLENNEYSLKRKMIKINNIHALKEKINKDMKDLDSLKFTIAANMTPRGTENGFVFGQPLDPLNTFREGIRLYKEELDLNTSLELIDNIQVIQDFTPRAKPYSPRLFFNIIVFGTGGFFLGVLLAFFLERKKLMEAIKPTL